MTISPKDLTAEERAILDACFRQNIQDLGSAIVSYGRALFTPESKKPAQAVEFIDNGDGDEGEELWNLEDAMAALNEVGKIKEARKLRFWYNSLPKHPAPVAAVRMTPELERVLFAAMTDANRDMCSDDESAQSYGETTKKCVAAVRAQAAAQPGKP